MPAQWTGLLIGEIHNAGFSIKAVANEAGLHPKYVSTVLNSNDASPKTEMKLRAALQRMKTQKEAESNENTAQGEI